MSNLSLTLLEQAIYNWLVPAYVPAAIFVNQRVPQPAFPFASIQLIGSAREGGRDTGVAVTDLTRAKSIRLTPALVADATYSITIGGTTYSYTASHTPTASEITAALKLAMAAAPGITSTDNHGALDLSAPVVFNITVTSNLSWANLDAGHEVVVTNTASRRLTYQITVHVDEANMVAGGAYAWAETIRSSLSMQSVVDAFYAQSIAVVKDNGVRDLSMPTNGVWISKAALDVVFRTTLLPSEDTGYIASITATGTVGSDSIVVAAP